ncbi:uncharacterized protein FTJAE_13076 [Fusarium tjaetaba]|uniref:Uncharacterized protein n=1 Tax=Fusarium tjaetaba TaxID=1567544 RepID=A0A8H5QKX6_9HYPO|nr:uncharacterized protein FTJAE_13076 [Fusarium tjaetaba]KAF5616133.1 hypothetical protein FTJAE_13076 [Fusarium tjaetaba]
MSSSSNTTDDQQQDSLSKLPTEVLLDIVGRDYLKWEDHWNLRRTSSRLFQLARGPMFQGGDYCIFRMACFRGDLDTLAICALYDAVPTECRQKCLFEGPLGIIQPGQGLHPSQTENDNYKESGYSNAWGDGLRGPGDTRGPDDTVTQAFYHGPGDIVTLGFYEGNFSAERFIEVWQWLSDQGCELFTFVKLSSLIIMPCPCFSSVLLSMLPIATDKARHQGICDVIHFLYSKGLRIPHPDRRHWVRGTWPAYDPLAKGNRPTILQTLLQTNCPPSIVELYLRQVNDEGLVFDYSRTWLSSPRGLGCISEFLRILFDDMFAPWIFKGDNTRSMGDDLQEKICLLTQHQGANAFELYMLQDIVTALRRIDARKVSRGYLDFDRDGVWCWYQLCLTVAYISDQNICSQTVDLHFTDPGDAEMINPYFRRAWAPHTELARARRGVLKKRALEAGQDPNGVQPQGVVPAGRRWAQMPLAAWDFIL